MLNNLRHRLAEFFSFDDLDDLHFTELDGDVDYKQDFTFFDHVLDFFGYVGTEEDEFETFFETFKQTDSRWAHNYNEYGSRYAPETPSLGGFDDPYLEAELRFDDY